MLIIILPDPVKKILYKKNEKYNNIIIWLYFNI